MRSEPTASATRSGVLPLEPRDLIDVQAVLDSGRYEPDALLALAAVWDQGVALAGTTGAAALRHSAYGQGRGMGERGS